MEMQIPVQSVQEGASDSPFLTSSQPRLRALITYLAWSGTQDSSGCLPPAQGPSQGDRCQQVLPLH